MGNVIPTTTIAPTTTMTPTMTPTITMAPVLSPVLSPVQVQVQPQLQELQIIPSPPPETTQPPPPASNDSLMNLLQPQTLLMSTNPTTINNIEGAFTISGFKDIKDMKETFGQVVLPPNMNSNELNNYVNSYNNNMSLLDDPNQLNKVAFDTYIHIQDKKINDLQTNLATLQKSMINNKRSPAPIKGLKSMSNAQMLNVEQYPDPTLINNGQDLSYKGNNARKYPNYLIYGNNGCLQYTPQPTGSVAPSWNFQSCNSNNPNQQFYTSQITNMDQDNAPITKPNNQNYVIQNGNNTQYGFYIVNPSTASDQCLQLNNDGLSVMPCNMEASQRFRPSYHSILQ